MLRIKITVMRRAWYDDLIEEYENPIEHACDMQVGQVFYWKVGRNPRVFAIVLGIVFRRLL